MQQLQGWRDGYRGFSFEEPTLGMSDAFTPARLPDRNT
jgi:hypothetical protein